MTRTARRLTKILAMLPWVIAHPGARVEEVCQRFSYTRRELIADLDLVFICGLPGYGPGDLMVAYVEDDEVYVDMADYFSAPLRLSPEEGLSLLAGGMALSATGQAPPALERAVDKLAKVMVPDAEDLLTVDLSAEPELVEVLRTGAREARAVRMTYTSLGKDETKERLIEPWSVFSSLGNWYVSGYCHSAQEERVFRVDRIQDAELTNQRFKPPDEIPPPEVRYTPSEDDVRAVIRLKPEARWVSEYYPVDVISEENGDLVVAFSTGDPLTAARILLRLGESARLIEGEEVEAEVERLRTEILARYRSQN